MKIYKTEWGISFCSNDPNGNMLTIEWPIAFHIKHHNYSISIGIFEVGYRHPNAFMFGWMTFYKKQKYETL